MHHQFGMGYSHPQWLPGQTYGGAPWGMPYPNMVSPPAGTPDPNMVSPPAGTPAAKLGVDPNSMSEKPKAKINSGGIPLYKMPHARLSECIEHIHDCFDPSLIGQLAQKTMVAVIWLLSRIAPYMKLQDFRCTYYEEVYEIIKTARQRWRKQNPIADDQTIQQLMTLSAPWQNAELMSAATKSGYQLDWTEPSTKNKKERPSMPTSTTVNRTEFNHQ